LKDKTSKPISSERKIIIPTKEQKEKTQDLRQVIEFRKNQLQHGKQCFGVIIVFFRCTGSVTSLHNIFY
jgi:hypothetical protein